MLCEMTGLPPWRTSIPAHSMPVITFLVMWPRPFSVTAIPEALPDHRKLFLERGENQRFSEILIIHLPLFTQDLPLQLI